MASTGPTGGSSAEAPLRVGARGGVFVVPKTGHFFEVPLGKAGAVVLLASVVSAGLMFAMGRAFSPEVPSQSPEWRRKADALGPVADRVTENAGPVFLNPMRNGIPGYCPTPEDARRAL